jgi:hypothetical protein
MQALRHFLMHALRLLGLIVGREISALVARFSYRCCSQSTALVQRCLFTVLINQPVCFEAYIFAGCVAVSVLSSY